MSKKAIALRFTSAVIFSTILILTLTGVYGLIWRMPPVMYDIHRISAWVLVAILPWKLVIAWGSLRRGLDRRFIRSVVVLASLVLATWTVLVFALAVYWAWRAGAERLWWYQTAISWHWYLALGLLLPFLFHAWQKWPRPRRTDLTSRRSALKLLGLGAGALALWGLSETLTLQREDPQQARSPAGSREIGSFTGLGYPVNHMIGEGKIRIDPADWKLQIKGAVAKPMALDLERVLARQARSVTATLDCTDGWHTTQVWQGLPLRELLDEAGISSNALAVILRAASGYVALLSIPEAGETLLATHVGGQQFDHGHGYPLRAVVPPRRGWQWVKWLVEVEVV
ncbi:MAG: molybdopterin-dependent oxidoreductase [Anaerolineales bacterium]|nr:molybdopterin-dependent oxidoreductase [Anaerolineales bacterium]